MSASAICRNVKRELFVVVDQKPELDFLFLFFPFLEYSIDVSPGLLNCIESHITVLSSDCRFSAAGVHMMENLLEGSFEGDNTIRLYIYVLQLKPKHSSQ